MAFNYQTQTPRALDSIGGMLQQRGQISAELAERIAAAEAAGEIGSANAWAGATSNIAQSVAQPLMQMGARMADPEYAVRKAQAESIQRDLSSQKLIEQAIMDPANRVDVKDDAGNVLGTRPDDTKVGEWLTKNGGKLGGHAGLQWNTIATANAENRAKLQKTLLEINGTTLDQAEKQQRLFTAQKAYVSELAWHTAQQLQGLTDDDAKRLAGTTFATSLAQAAVDGGLDPKRAKQIGQQVAGAPPDKILDVVNSLIDPNDRASLEAKAAETKLKGAQAKEAESRARAIDQYGGTGAPPASQHIDARMKGEFAKFGDVPLEFKPGRTAADPGRYFINLPTGAREVFPGRDFVKVPPSQVIVNQAAQAAFANMPAWATDASRPNAKDPASNTIDKNLGRTPNGLYQDALNFINDGQYPPSGRGNDPAAQMLRTAIDSKVGAIAADAGMDVPTMRAIFKANAGSLKAMQQYADSAQAFMATADKNMSLLERALEKTPDLGAPVLNKPWREFNQQVLGSEAMSQFRTYLQSIRNEYGKIITSPNLSAQFTDSARHEAGDLLSDDATVGQILESAKALKAEGSNRLASLGEQLGKIRERMQTPPPGDGRGGAQNQPPAVQPGTPDAQGYIYALDKDGHGHRAKAGQTLPAGWTFTTAQKAGF